MAYGCQKHPISNPPTGPSCQSYRPLCRTKASEDVTARLCEQSGSAATSALQTHRPVVRPIRDRRRSRGARALRGLSPFQLGKSAFVQ
eukprot:8842675-Pyramimonas_sp.AAC.1